MLKRNDYLKLIEEIRNTERRSLDEYIVNVLEPLRLTNPYFLETLYKDIHYLLKGLDKPGENDLEIKNGSLVIEDGGIKLTGYQSRLHNLSFWLHIEILKGFMEKNPLTVSEKLEEFEKYTLNKPNYTPEYKAELDKIKKSLSKERKQNLGERDNLWNKVFDLDNLELKPNIAGIGLNLNNFLDKFK